MKRLIPILAASAVLCAACTKEINENQLKPQDQQTFAAKLVGGSDGEIVPGSLLVKLDKETTAKIEEGRFDEVADGIFGDLKIKSISPAIPVMPKNKKVAEKYGLLQWFNVEYDTETEPKTAAVKLAASESIRSIQFNKYVRHVKSERVCPVEPALMTKSGDNKELLFNDPYSFHQWNLHNDGTISPTAVAGADVGVKDAWRLTGGDPSVVVAVFDCGLEVDHEDLADAIWRNEDEIPDNNIDDDGNGYIDDYNGFNFINCFAVDSVYTDSLLKGEKRTAIAGKAIDATQGTGHGTHVGGIIGAVNGNGKGVSSIAGGTGKGDGVRLMSVQMFDGYKYTTDAQSAAAFIYAADNGACIAQCSWAADGHIITSDEVYKEGTDKIKGSPLEYRAIQYFLDPENSNHESLRGNIAVFSAGNYGKPYSIYPGALSDVISVTAFGYDFLPGGYTNYGPGCKIAAPGGEFCVPLGEIMSKSNVERDALILSTGVSAVQDNEAVRQSILPGVETGRSEDYNYVYMQGTSMACPHVSGVLALGISYAKKLGKTFTREELTSLLLSSVNDIDQYLTSGTKKFYDSGEATHIDISLNRYYGKMGTGAVDAWKFLMAIEGTPSVIIEADATSSLDLSNWCSPSGKYEIEVDDATRESLGLTSDPVIKDGRLEITCSKVGAGKILLKSSVGKDTTREDGIGSMDYSREISIVSREFATKNGGWL